MSWLAQSADRTRRMGVKRGRVLHGIVSAPHIREKLPRCQPWPEYKFTRGSYTCPVVGQYTTLLKVTGEPELDGRLIFAGEHTSGEFSGFMNGAVQSGNRAAQEILQQRKTALSRTA